MWDGTLGGGERDGWLGVRTMAQAQDVDTRARRSDSYQLERAPLPYAPGRGGAEHAAVRHDSCGCVRGGSSPDLGK